MFDADYVRALNQVGLIKRDMADSEANETKKKQMSEDSKRLLLKALNAASEIFSRCPGVNEYIGEVWNSFPLSYWPWRTLIRTPEAN